MKTIQLTHGKFAILDDEDYERLSHLKWHYANHGYAVRSKCVNYKTSRIYLHREVVGCGKDEFCDHKNMDLLDCRKENLRVCTKQQNAFNITKHKDNKSGYNGVFFNSQAGKYQAVVCVSSKRIHLGYYEVAEEASIAYDFAALMLHGEFARTNVHT